MKGPLNWAAWINQSQGKCLGWAARGPNNDNGQAHSVWHLLQLLPTNCWLEICMTLALLCYISICSTKFDYLACIFMKLLSGFKAEDTMRWVLFTPVVHILIFCLFSTVHCLTWLLYLSVWVGICFWEEPEVQGGQVYSWAVCLLAMNSLFIFSDIWTELHLHSDQSSKLGALMPRLLFMEHNWLLFPTMFKFLPECFCLSSFTCTSTWGLH